MAGEDPTAAAIAAADAAIAAAEAGAAEGEANANLAYTLSTQILQDNNWELIVPLDMLVLKIINEGLQAYTEVATKAAAADQQVQTAASTADQQAASLLQQYENQFKNALGG
jgi:hypothetical protein